jgi:hypothetical protein
MSEKSKTVGRPKGSVSYQGKTLVALRELGVKSIPVQRPWWRALRGEETKSEGRGRPKGTSCGHTVKLTDIEHYVTDKASIPVLKTWFQNKKAANKEKKAAANTTE